MSDDVLIDTALAEPLPLRDAHPDAGDSESRAQRHRPSWVDGVREYGCLTAAVGLVVAIMVRPWVGGWRSPIVYGNDTLSHLAMLDGAGLTGTARGPAQLGAPTGLSWVDFPLGPDRVHLILFRVLKLLAGDAFLALNLYLLLGFFLVAWAAFAVLRALRISPLVAGAISIAFTIAPYHFARMSDGHVFLAAYFSVPLGVLLAIWASDGSISARMGRSRIVATVACVAVVGSSSAYYAVFSLVMIASLGVVLAIRRGAWRALLVPLVLCASIGAVVVANVVGDELSNRSAGANNEVSARPASDSDAFGLRLAQMVLPIPDHRIPALAALGRGAYEIRTPGEQGASVGLLAVAGLLAIAWSCIRSVGAGRVGGAELGTPTDGSAADRPALMSRLGVMALAGVLAASVSSAGFIVALLGFGQIRVWSRMSIVLAFIGLTGLAVLLDRCVASARVSRQQMGPVLIAVAVVAVAILDQTSPGSLPDRSSGHAAQLVDQRIAADMAAALPEHAEVFQLPQIDFLFADMQGDMPLYGLLGPWASGTGTLEYSAGAMEGRGGDWQRSWATQPPEVLVAGVAAAGFDAVYLDRRSEDGASVGTASTAGWLRRQFGVPSGVVRDGGADREWFDLRPVRRQLIAELGSDRVVALGRAVRRPIGVGYSGAVDRFAVGGGARLVLPRSTITLRNEQVAADGTTLASGATAPVTVSFDVSGAAGSTVEISAGGNTRTVVLDDGPAPVELTLALDQRDTEISIRTSAPRLAGAEIRHGDVRLQVSQVHVVDAALAAAIDDGSLELR